MNLRDKLGDAYHEPRVARARLYVGWWLLSTSALVFAMILLGGITRLTESGLSMVDWRPFTGVLPPIGQEQWEVVFEQYKEFPEYKQINLGMSLAEFKMIFWFEYSHRLLGRVIGIVFLLPFLFFLFTRRLQRDMALTLGALFILGAIQGFLGWFMVKSGLSERADVSQHRLAAHFGLAVFIYGTLIWGSFSMLCTKTNTRVPTHQRDHLLSVFLPWLFLTMISGAFVAGTNAGFIYNTFPLWDGSIVPAEVFDLRPVTMNLFHNPVAIQFIHRTFAILTIIFAVVIWIFAYRKNFLGFNLRYNLFLLSAVIQFVLGIVTLITAVPLVLGVLHQMGALLLLSATIFALHGSIYRRRIAL